MKYYRQREQRIQNPEAETVCMSKSCSIGWNGGGEGTCQGLRPQASTGLSAVLRSLLLPLSQVQSQQEKSDVKFYRTEFTA